MSGRGEQGIPQRAASAGEAERAVAVTSASLIERLRSTAAGPADWQRLHDIYAVMIRHWVGRLCGPTPDADDLAQEVWLTVHRTLPGFVRLRDGSFRAWLRQLTTNQIRNWRRRQRHRPDRAADDLLAQLEDANSQLARQWDREHDRYVFDKILAVVRPDFATATWDLFRRFALEGRAAAAVAAEFGTTEAAVVQAKARILKRLRADAAGLID